MNPTLTAPPPQRFVEVVSDPEILGGWPVIYGTRIAAENILACIKSGYSDLRIVEGYPSMPVGGIDAVRRWAVAQGLLPAQ
ncbi:MAG: DUF433 domain-containing protein [Sphingomonadales bacterium]